MGLRSNTDPVPRTLRHSGSEPELLQPRQDFGGEIRQLLEIVDEVDGQAVETRRSKPGELPHDSVRITDDTVGPAARARRAIGLCPLCTRPWGSVRERPSLACISARYPIAPQSAWSRTYWR